jgi:hypothetical protein
MGFGSFGSSRLQQLSLTASGNGRKRRPKLMETEKTKTAIILGAVALVAVLILGGITFLIFKVRAQAAQQRALAELKENNPVKYYILHTPLTQTEGELRNALAGTWELAGAKSLRSGEFVRLESPHNYQKTFTPTNWAIIARDANSNELYTASGHYTLQGENCTETIEAATGAKAQFLGTHPTFRIRLDGDKFYEMGTGKDPSIEQMWQRIGQ